MRGQVYDSARRDAGVHGLELAKRGVLEAFDFVKDIVDAVEWFVNQTDMECAALAGFLWA